VYKLALSLSLPFAIVLGIALYFFASDLAIIFGNERLTLPFKIVAHIIPFATWYEINAEAYRGMKKMVGYSILQRGTVVLIAVATLLYLRYSGVETDESPLIAFVSAVVVLSLIAAFTTPRAISNLVPKKTISDSQEISLRPLLKVAFPMLISTSMFMIMNWTDTLMIGYYLDEAEVGIYRLAFKVATLITFAQFAINSIAAPMFSSFKAQDDLAGLIKMTRNIGYMNLAISTPIFIAILIFPSFVLDFFGEEFTAGVYPLIILAIGQIINALCGPVMYLLNMTGKEKQARNIIIVASVINVALNLYFIPLYGLMGAAIATGVSTVVWNVMAVFQIKKEYGFISIPHPF
jgi:O-antigen/teichoic acid export membrane protein